MHLFSLIVVWCFNANFMISVFSENTSFERGGTLLFQIFECFGQWLHLLSKIFKVILINVIVSLSVECNLSYLR